VLFFAARCQACLSPGPRVSTSALAVVVGLLALTACSSKPPLPEYDPVPEFSLTDSHGQVFTSKELNDRVWVADFIFTHCPGPCPRMTSEMHKLQLQSANDDDIRFVSFSVDPDRDTPAVLNEFAHRFGGPTPQWVFLTGKPETIHLLAKDVFHVGDLIGVMDHSTKFILVDKRSKIRGYYSTFDAEGLPKLREDIRRLRKES
jgi:protein SCO1